jgi:hypothetical protein
MTERQNDEPAPWESVKMVLLPSGKERLDVIDLPDSFTCPPELMHVFDEMLPILSDEEMSTFKKRVLDGALQPPPKKARNILTDTTGQKFLIRNENVQEAHIELLDALASAIITTIEPNQIGRIQTHAIDIYPTSPELAFLLSGQLLFEFVITPTYADLLFLTNKYPPFGADDNNFKAAIGYLDRYGSAHGKPKYWTANDKDFAALKIVLFRMSRESNTFERKNLLQV